MAIMIGLALLAWFLMAMFEPKGNPNIDYVYKKLAEKEYPKEPDPNAKKPLHYEASLKENLRKK